MDEYKRVLNEWARRKLDIDGAVVTSVEVNYDEGYRYSSYTFEDPHFDVYVSYKVGDDTGYQQLYGDDEIKNLGELLTELFAIASAGD